MSNSMLDLLIINNSIVSCLRTPVSIITITACLYHFQLSQQSYLILKPSALLLLQKIGENFVSLGLRLEVESMFTLPAVIA